MDELEENDIEALESALSMLGQNKVKGKMSRVLVRIWLFFCYRVKESKSKYLYFIYCKLIWLNYIPYLP